MVEDPHHPPVFLRRGITRTKSSDEKPLHKRPATATADTSFMTTYSPTMVVADDDDTSITTNPPLCSPRLRAPPGRSVSVLVPGSTRTTTPATATSTSGTERRMGAPPNLTRSVLSSTRGSLSRTHTGDGMAEMALWRQEQLQLLQAKNNKQRTTAKTLFLPDGGPSITPIVRTHSKITVLQKLREQRQQQQQEQEQQQQQQMLLLATQQKQQRVGLDKGEESDDGSSIIMAEFREGDEESETTNEDGSSSEEEDVYSSDGDGDDSDFDD